MDKVKHKIYLQTTSLKFLENWSVQYLLESKFSYNEKYPLLPLGSFLTRSRNKSLIEDDKIYQRVTVKLNNGGIVPRDTEQGINIGTKQQYIIKPSQFLMSKIDARNGAFGLVPKTLDGAIVTNDFPVFDVKTSIINPQFLVLITTTKEFLKFAQSCSSGTTNRQRIDIDLFLNVKIPLPPLFEQNRIVKAYNKKIKLAEEQEQKADDIERNIDKIFLEQLGFRNDPVSNYKKKFWIIFFRDIARWDLWVNKEVAKSNLYENTQLQSLVLGKPFYGANVKGVNKKSHIRYIRITDINENGFLNDKFVSPEFIEEKYLLKHNDFLIARSGNTVGKTFLYKEEFGKAIYAGYLVKYNLDTNKVLPEYLLHYTKSSIFKKWIEANQRVSGQPNINGQEFLQSPVILPPLSIQKKIIDTVTQRKLKSKELKQSAERNRIDAINDFEKEVFIT